MLGFGQRQNEIIRIGNIYVAEHRIAVLTGIARSRAQFIPRLAVVVGNIPITVVADLQFRRDAVIALIAGTALERGQPLLLGPLITVLHRKAHKPTYRRRHCCR